MTTTLAPIQGGWRCTGWGRSPDQCPFPSQLGGCIRPQAAIKPPIARSVNRSLPIQAELIPDHEDKPRETKSGPRPFRLAPANSNPWKTTPRSIDFHETHSDRFRQPIFVSMRYRDQSPKKHKRDNMPYLSPHYTLFTHSHEISKAVS